MPLGPHAYEFCGAVLFAGRRHHAFARLAELSGAEAGGRVLDVGAAPAASRGTWPPGSGPKVR
ncbi:hypothetical protein [Streptomyces sp. HC307]|uniref:hypothetical protein n=1 Tax=Streptomyces flavusporus TaxID=3385496 RepID=UPI003916EFA3